MPRRRLKLVGTRYTIGSDPECSVRLEHDSVRPLHAVLVRDCDRVVVRGLGQTIRVNGLAVSETPLRLGDSFTIGLYEFELTRVPARGASSEADSSGGNRSAAAADDDAKVIPRRRLSLANTLRALADDPAAVDRNVPHADSTPPGRSNPVRSNPVPSSASSQAAVAATQTDDSPTTQSPTAQAPTDRPPVDPASKTKTDDSKVAERSDSLERQRAVMLAAEQRWQQRNERQLEKLRQLEQRSADQIEALRTAHQAAERRASEAEDAVQSLKQQMAELSGRFAALSSTVMTGLEQRIDQQHQQSMVSSRQHQSLVEGLRSRLDFLQTSLSEIQAETEQIRQQTVATREDQQEFAANANSMEKNLQQLSEDYQADRASAEAKTEQLRQNLYQASLKLADLTGQLEDTRQQGCGLGAMVQQLRESLESTQSEAQRFATVDKIEETIRLLKANDLRIIELTEAYDSQSNQFQNQCDALRQRIETTEQMASDAISAASKALTEAALPRSSKLSDSADRDRAEADQVAIDQDAIEPVVSEREPADEEQADEERAEQEWAKLESVDAKAINQPAINQPAIEQDEIHHDPTDSDQDDAVSVSESQFFSKPSDDAADDSYGSNWSRGDDRPSAIGTADHIDLDDAEADRASQPVAWYYGESDDDEHWNSASSAEDDGEESISSSQFHLPLELGRDPTAEAPLRRDTSESPVEQYASDAALSESRNLMDHGQGVPHDSASDFDSESMDSEIDPEAIRRESAEEDRAADDNGDGHQDEYYASTYEMDPETGFNFSRMQSAADANGGNVGEQHLTSVDGDLPTEDESKCLQPENVDLGVAPDAEEETTSPVADEEPEDDFQATAFLDIAPAKQSADSDSVTTGQRSAREILTSMGLAYNEEDAEVPIDHDATSESNERVSNAGNAADDASAASVIAAPADPVEQESEDDSIEAYMNRLLRRVQGQSDARAGIQSEPVVRPEPVVTEQRSAAPNPATTEDAAEPEKFDSTESTPYTPRSHAPEKTSDLAAMRELANSSARTAIAESARRKMSNEVMFKFGLFGLGVLAGCAVLIGTQFEMGPWLVIGMCCFGLAGFFFFEGLTLRSQLLESNRVDSGSSAVETGEASDQIV
jgi:hypothetical protein